MIFENPEIVMVEILKTTNCCSLKFSEETTAFYRKL
jgi:hypothetical protein